MRLLRARSKRTRGVCDSWLTVRVTLCSVENFSAAERMVAIVASRVASSGARASSQAVTELEMPLVPPGLAITLPKVASDP